MLPSDIELTGERSKNALILRVGWLHRLTARFCHHNGVLHMPFGCAKEVFTPPVLPAQSDEGSSSVKNVLENRRVRSPAKAKKKSRNLTVSGLLRGPSVEIRTQGLLNPIQARYQTSPHPDSQPNHSSQLDYYTTPFRGMQGVFWNCSEDYSFIENESSLIHFSKFLTDLPDWEFVVRRFKNGQPSYPL